MAFFSHLHYLLPLVKVLSLENNKEKLIFLLYFPRLFVPLQAINVYYLG